MRSLDSHSNLYIISLKYIKPLEEVEKYMQAHRSFLDKYFTQGKFLVAGRKVPRTGGIIICSAAALSEAENIAREDPFYINGVAGFEITEFAPTACHDKFGDVLHQD